ncbi:MAG: sulfite exporter TauE/SafE family protein [Planctomycetota bacterium]|nr:MAG: sulfite exporter TauE/SafE family protein [Planctomycetota bacterium]
MIELPLIFVGGLLGSAHCVGMCGGFALLIGAPTRRLSANLARQVIYSLGRIFTYGCFGAAVGFGGLRLSDDLGGFVNVQAVVAIVAGVLLIAQGLVSAGVVGRASRALRLALAPAGVPVAASPAGGDVGLGCLMGGIVGTFLRDRRLSSVFLAGVLTGLMPCGLVYAYVALAAGTGDPLLGLTTMAAFGLGTVPLMMLTGGGLTLLSLAGRRRLLYLAAWCVVLTGLVSTARGVGFLELPGQQTAATCPMCD